MIRLFVKSITEFMGNPADLQVHLLPPTEEKEPQAILLYLKSITDEAKINELVLKPIQDAFLEKDDLSDLSGIFIHNGFPVNGSLIDKNVSSVALQLFEGKCVLLTNGLKNAIAADVSQWHDRSVTPPETEHSLIGPRDAFVEDLNVNISMIRRRIRHEDLHIEQFTVGTKSRTTINLVYMKSLVNNQVLEQLQQRLQSIETDVLVDTTQLGHMITNKSKSFNPFPLFQTTERPDKVVPAIMEGRILLLANTTPTGALFPATVTALYQTTDDYYFPSLSGTFLRMVRFTGLLTTLFLPGLYVSITSVNYDVLRIQFMLAVAASREGVPYPAYIEVLIMMTLLELINEATVRLPKVIGGTATIVGGLIIGTSAAQSHLVSNIMIVITGAVAVGSYTVANYMIGIAWRMSSYALMLLAIPWGLNGMAIGSAFILLYLCHIKSMGVPYLSPLSTFQLRELFSDALLRLPTMMNPFRPSIYSPAAKGTRRVRLRKGEDLL
ncbi:spore germination protein [Paenibacillus puerhi]|uniref:spore germination protein n=1 Tax=Paenibacillus puerhi TaxID=2692622 RepID=UPI0013598234|nr:spore germination protein [Paenibacillus puerhi]